MVLERVTSDAETRVPSDAAPRTIHTLNIRKERENRTQEVASVGPATHTNSHSAQLAAA